MKVSGLKAAAFSFAIAAGLLGVVSQASATTILDTTVGSSNNTAWSLFDDGSGNFASVALPFTWGAAITVTDVTAYINLTTAGPGSVDLGIMADNGSGVPSGTFLYSTVVSLDQTNPVVLSSLNWSISGNTQYWLAAIAASGTSAEWQAHSAAVGTFADNSTGGGGWQAYDNINLPEAVIASNVSATPLPAALPLFLSGAGGFGLLAWRRKKKGHGADAVATSI